MKLFVVKFPIDYGVSQLIMRAESKEECIDILIDTINKNIISECKELFPDNVDLEYWLNDTAMAYFGDASTKREALQLVANAEIRELSTNKGIIQICKYIE